MESNVDKEFINYHTQTDILSAKLLALKTFSHLLISAILNTF